MDHIWNTNSHPSRLILATLQAFLLGISLLSSSLMAATVKVSSIEGIGANERIMQTYAELIKMSLRQGKHVVVIDEKASAELIFNPKITQVGQSYILTIEKLGKDGSSFEDSFKVASEAELDLGTKRLVNAVLAGKSAASSISVQDVGEAEVNAGVARQATLNRVQLAFGPTGAYGMNTNGTFYDFEAAYTWERDNMVPRLFTEFNWGPGIKEAFALTAGLGLDYYLTRGKEAPYLGFELGLGGFHRASSMDSVRDGRPMYKSGFALGANAGFAIMRNADTTMFIQANFRPILGGIGGKSAGLFGIQVGLMY